MSASRSTAAACTSLQEGNRSSFVGCARSLASLPVLLLLLLLLRRALAGAEDRRGL
jgi:hypothetical protein